MLWAAPRSLMDGRFLACLGLAATISVLLNLSYLNWRSGREDSTCQIIGASAPPDPFVVSDVDEKPAHEKPEEAWKPAPVPDTVEKPEPWEALPLMSVEPKVSFRDNLLPGTKYITTWPSNGWTNDVMAFINLLYLGLLSDRVPILARFAPTHVGDAAGFIAFSEVFDLPRLSKAINTPIIEWKQLKNMSTEQVEELGCWGTHSTLFNGGVLHSTTEYHMGLDVAYTPIPNSAHIAHDYNEYKASFMGLAALSYPETRAAAIANPPRPVQASPRGHTLPPDDQLECFDFTYDLGMHEPWEWEFEWCPAWKKVGQYTYFNPSLVSLAEGMVKRAFGLEESADLPTMITLHIRRADFKVWCNDVPAEECLAPLSAYVRRVEQVKEELRTTKGIGAIDHVLVSSDERDPEWWAQVRQLGWYAIDHDAEGTEEKYGRWYPVLIDVCAQSFGKGFVGTDRSTLSLVSLKRVVDWNDGVYRRVRWGNIGADDY